jgi:hypothetical protein
LFLIGDPPRIPLCLDCEDKRQRMIEREHDRLARELNYLDQEMEAISGLPPGVLPRYPIAPLPLVHSRPVTFHNIRVEGSTIGSINTGTIQQLDVAIGQAQGAGAEPLADAVKVLAEALVQSRDLADARKSEALEQLTLLTQQAQLPRAERKPGLIRAALNALGDTAKTVTGLIAAWEKARPYLEQLLPQ